MKNIRNFLKNDSNFFLIILVGLIFIIYFLDKELAKFFGVAGFLIWLIQKYVEQILSKDLEKFKTNLEKEAIEFRIKYEKLHAERAEVILEMNKKIYRTFKAMHSFVNIMQLTGEPSLEEKAKVAANEANKLVDFYEENNIFFEEDVDNELEKLMREFKNIWLDFNLSKSLKPHSDESLKAWMDAWKKISEEVPIIRKLIKNRFRKIIGIENKSNDYNKG